MFNVANGRDAVGHYGGFGNPDGNYQQKPLTYGNVKKIRMYADWGKDIKGGIGDFIREYVKSSTHLGNNELIGVKGPGLTHNDLSKDVMVPLLMIQNGLRLSYSQDKMLRAFRTLLSDTLHPVTTPQAHPVFILTYIDTEQSLAQPGNLHTLTGGNATTIHEIRLELMSKTTGVTIGDIALFFTNNVEDIVTALTEKLLQMECTWNITLANDHAQYCATQPGFGETLILNGQLPEQAARSQLHSALQLESLVCGAINRNPHNLTSLVTAAAKAINKRLGNCVAVIPQIIITAVSGSRTLTAVELGGETTSRVMTYDVTRPEGLNGHCYIGVASTEVTTDAMSHRKVDVIDKTGNDGDKLVVPGIKTNHSTMPIITLDDTPLSSNNSFSIQDTLSRTSTKRLFFTVGAPPLAYERMCSPGFFNGKMDVTPGMLAIRSPRTSYITDWERGQSLDKITLPEINAICNTNNAYNIGLKADEIRGLSNDALQQFDEGQNANLLELKTYNEKIDNIQSVFDVSARIMLVRAPGDTAAGIPTIATLADNSTFNVVPRTVLGNASPLNNLSCDIVNIVSGMTAVAPNNADLQNYLDFIKDGFTDTSLAGYDDTLAVRTLPQFDDLVPGAVLANIIAKTGMHFMMTDLKCQLQLINTLEKILTLTWPEYDAILNPPVALNAAVQGPNPALPQGGAGGGPQVAPAPAPQIGAGGGGGGGGAAQNAPAPQGAAVLPAPAWFDPALHPFWSELKSKLQKGHVALSKLISTLFAENLFCWPLTLQNEMVSIHNVPQNYTVLLKFYYAVVIPSFTSNLVLRTAMIHQPNAYINQNNIFNGVYLPVYQRGTLFVPDNYPHHIARAGTIFDSNEILDRTYVSVFRPLFKKRYELSMAVLGSGTYEMLLWMAHMMTSFNQVTSTRHFDVKYPSGMAYTGIRTVRFTGYDIAVLPQNSTNLIFGNMYAAWSTVSSVASTYNQVVESGLYPKKLDSVGVVLRNAFCNKISGYGKTMRETEDTVIVFVDSPSGFSPETTFGSGTTGDIMPLSGRFDGDDTYGSGVIDQVSGHFSVNPFMNPIAGDAATRMTRWIAQHNPGPEHAYVSFLNAAKSGDYRTGLPAELRDIVQQTPQGVVEGIVNGAKSSSALSEVLGLAFVDTYGMCAGSDLTTKTSSNENNTTDKMLTPIVMGEGLTASYLNGEDTAYVAKFGRLTGVEADFRTYPNSF